MHFFLIIPLRMHYHILRLFHISSNAVVQPYYTKRAFIFTFHHMKLFDPLNFSKSNLLDDIPQPIDLATQITFAIVQLVKLAFEEKKYKNDINNYCG